MLPFAGPAWLDRALVALTVGGGAGLVVAGLTAAARTLPVVVNRTERGVAGSG